MKSFDDDRYLVDMYDDDYFPDFLVDKIKSVLARIVRLLDSGERNREKIQSAFDEATGEINDLQDEFDEHGSEIETVARDSIGRTVEGILKHYGIDLDTETALRQRDW